MVWFLIVSVFRSQYGTTLNLICLVTCWFHRCHKYVRLTMPQLPASGLFNIVVMLTGYRTSQCLSLKPRRGFGANLLVYDFTSSRVQNIDMRPSFAFRFFPPLGPRELPRDPREYWCICFRHAVASQAIAVLGGDRPKIAMSPLNVTRVTPSQCVASF